ncbi:hypothetical protein EYF80_022574 [Liparis tanakae]|uniref:Uncharacterized protein n=1 Tax=Liparis tanakae TaxID=230148 RepID=A0A4Z2HN08_9TELE|nr:hypothetical protein EYF80_022574 [Liparis tanakae]
MTWASWQEPQQSDTARKNTNFLQEPSTIKKRLPLYSLRGPEYPKRHAHREVFASSSQRRLPSGLQGFATHWFTDEEHSWPWYPFTERPFKPERAAAGEVILLVQANPVFRAEMANTRVDPSVPKEPRTFENTECKSSVALMRVRNNNNHNNNKESQVKPSLQIRLPNGLGSRGVCTQQQLCATLSRRVRLAPPSMRGPGFALDG